ncbi:MAG: cyclic-di-AMP receptor [Defluviitaleaceae bacterium]|nr:cyclic-di-AMP receptor [Defluviitaleaceae bacterium]
MSDTSKEEIKILKLVIAIVHDDDAGVIMDNLRESGFSVTKLASSGGFLRIGNTTILSGVEEERLEELLKIIKENGSSRTQIAPSTPSFFEALQAPVKITLGGATIFVLDVDKFIRF